MLIPSRPIALAALACLIQSMPAWAMDSTHAKIESVDGAKTVLLQHGIALREVSPGEEVLIGERIRTDQRTTVVILYHDGSKVTVLPNTDMEIEKLEGGVQSNLLRSGYVRGAIEKVKQASPPIHFVIRTKSAVMGVRGTEFVAAFNAETGLAQFNTLEGTVEVAGSPSELMGGQGVPVTGGHFVQATSDGVGAVQRFNPSSFLKGLTESARAAVPSGSGGGASPGSNATAAIAAADNRAQAPAPQPAPAPKLPPPPEAPPPPPAVVEQRKAEAEAERPHMHLLAFSLGAFFAQNPDPQTATGLPYYRSLEVNWTPIIPLPVLSFLYVRGGFGATMFEDYSLNNAFLVHEYQAFAGTTLLSPLFVEVGGGEQIWRNEGIDSAVLNADAGLIVRETGRLNRVYVGVSKFFKGTQPLELHAGVILSIF